ncbi:hypothetical protein PV762_00095 [Mitsuaria sp. CC2]|uniref:hypothetical protein n=1 Tax=Mitsuaria sp. CC2 TaxID=3029186 RepID=UPI003B8B219C
MRPPDNLDSLKGTPIAMFGAGGLVIPAMWAFLLAPGVVLTMAPITGLLFLLAGLHMTYRSRFSPGEALWSFLLALIFFGSLLVASTTSLAWRMARPDLQGLAVGLAAFIGGGALLLGFLAERRRLLPKENGVPVALLPTVDLQRHQLHPSPASGTQPTMGRIAFLSALALNVPLLLQMNGLRGDDIVWLAMPVLGATVTYVLATGFGPSLARILALRVLERRDGRRFTTSRFEELTQMRRHLWLARWLCREEDLAAPSVADSGRNDRRSRRR